MRNINIWELIGSFPKQLMFCTDSQIIQNDEELLKKCIKIGGKNKKAKILECCTFRHLMVEIRQT